MHLIEATAQSAAQLHAMATHAAALETQLREQQGAVAQAEAAAAAHAATAHEVDSLRTERERLQVQLEHYVKRTEELLAERGRGTQQLAELGRSVAAERLRARLEVGELQAVIGGLEEEVRQGAQALELGEASRRALEAQNAQLHADLREVMTLIDQLEGEPGFATQHLRQPLPPPPPPAASMAAVAPSVGLDASAASLSASTKAAVRATAARLVAGGAVDGCAACTDEPARAAEEVEQEDDSGAVARQAGAAAGAAAEELAEGLAKAEEDDGAPDERALQALWLRGPEALGAALSKRARGPGGKLAAAEAALAMIKEAMGRLEAEEAVLRRSLAEAEGEATSAAASGGDGGGGGGAGHDARLAEEVGLLREENRLLEAQLALLSEKVYGSPAKSAALERDRLQIELEAERRARAEVEQECARLEEALEEARRTQQALNASGLVEELEKTRHALHAAQASAAYAASAQMPGPASARATPVRAGYNPIAMPRRQFGLGQQRAAALGQRHEPRPGSFQAPWSAGGPAPHTPWSSGLGSGRSYRSSRGSVTPAAYYRAPSISCATPR